MGIRDWLLNVLYSDEYMDNYLEHVGKAHDQNPPGPGSGRYAWGTGKRKFQRSYDLYSRIRKLEGTVNPETGKKYTESEIAKALGFYKTDNKGNVIYNSKGEPEGNTALLRAKKQIARNDVWNDLRSQVLEMEGSINPDTGKLYTRDEIAKTLGIKGESTVRSILNNDSGNTEKTTKAAEDLKALVGDGNYIDIGRGAELGLGVSPDRLKVALEMLKEEGYSVQEIYVNQLGMQNGAKTTIKVLCPPGAEPGDAWRNRFDIKPVADPDGDTTLTLLGMQEPTQVDLSRVKVRFDEDGGTLKDGVIEIRAKYDKDGNLVPACEDLSLGNAKYAQVRIAVDGGDELGPRYIKGMAVYNPDLPNGVDILLNSNKSVEDGLDGALKKMNRKKDGTVDSDNPFGATVFQTEYEPGKLSAINVVSDIYGVDKHEEGAWGEWSRNLPSQFLGKQSEALVKQQLRLKALEKQQEYEEIISLTNPIVKRKLLLEFADSCDAAAVDLKAAPLPGQKVQVILPLTSIKQNEIYAPNFENGSTVALVRFPHAGAFEIPIVRVNNNNKEAKAFMKDASDAIGINSKTAAILSGADFDGDTAIVIPMTRKNSQGEFERVVNIKGIGNGQEKLPGLDGFNPQEAYPYKKGMKVMDKQTKGREMGVISNLITDMSLKGCDNPDELARAVKYSMVVIDAEKHKLNYIQAEKNYNIKELKQKYQYNSDGSHGVSTLLSRAKSPVDVPQRRMVYDIDPKTGEKLYSKASNRFYEEEVKVKALAPAGYTWTDKDGKTHKSKYLKDENGKDVYATDPNTGRTLYSKTGNLKERTQKSTRMAEAKDAYELLSEHPSNKEYLYADFANKMKSLANTARKESLTVESYKADPVAKKKYAEEVKGLDEKLNRAKANAPKERQAQLLATQIVNAAKQDNPDMDKEELTRKKAQALNGARARTGAKKEQVTFTDAEWEAVNARAISANKLTQLLDNGDPDNYKQLATPKKSRVSDSTSNYINALLDAGWTKAEIVDAGIASSDTVRRVQNGGS